MSTINYKHGGDKEKRKAARKAAKEAERKRQEQWSEKLNYRKILADANYDIVKGHDINNQFAAALTALMMSMPPDNYTEHDIERFTS